jgi:hypothetical protein
MFLHQSLRAIRREQYVWHGRPCEKRGAEVSGEGRSRSRELAASGLA